MKIIRVGNGYVTEVELSRGEIIKIEIDTNKQPVSFNEEDAEQIKEKLEKTYQHKNIVAEIVIEDI